MAFLSTEEGRIIQWKERTRETPSPHFSLGIDRSGGQRTINQVPYIDAEALAQFAVGYSELASFVTEGVFGRTVWYIKRQTPWRMPLKRNRSVYCMRCDWNGVGTPSTFDAKTFDPELQIDTTGDGDQFAHYDTATLHLDYETPTYDILTDDKLIGSQPATASHGLDEATWLRYVTPIIRPQGELFTIQGSTNNGYFASGPTLGGRAFPINDSLHKSVASKSISITWHQVPIEAVPDKAYQPAWTTASNLAIDWCMGRVNDRTFNGFPAGTLMLQSADIKRCTNCIGDRFVDITYQIKQFQPREVGIAYGNDLIVFPGHNHTFLPTPRLTGATFAGGYAATQGWYEMLADDTIAQGGGTNFRRPQRKGVSPYDFGNFANLFRPAQYTQDIVT